MARSGSLHIKTLEGSPITIGEAILIPQALLVTWGRRQVSVTWRGFGGWGWACGLLIPRAVIEQRGDQKRRIPIPDRTGQALLAMVIVALAVALLSLLVQMFMLSLSAEGKGD